MTGRSRTIAIAILLPTLSLLVAIALLWKKSVSRAQAPIEISTEQSSQFETKQNDEGNVTVAVTPQILTLGKPISFVISLNTHSVALDFDLPIISTLTDDQDNSLGTATWNGSPPGGHHRNGTLIFPSPLSAQTKSITLTLISIAGIPKRIFTWEVKSR